MLDKVDPEINNLVGNNLILVIGGERWHGKLQNQFIGMADA